MTKTSDKLGGRGRSAGFTIVELLVVMFILAVVVAIITSVGAYVLRIGNERDTASTQRIIMDAVQAYYDNSRPNRYPPDRYADDPYDGLVSGHILLLYLTYDKEEIEDDGGAKPDRRGAKAAQEVLMNLPQEAWDIGDQRLYDSYGQDPPMRYDADGGLGGKPVLISAGPDRKFSETDTDLENAADDIRSDESE